MTDALTEEVKQAVLRAADEAIVSAIHLDFTGPQPKEVLLPQKEVRRRVEVALSAVLDSLPAPAEGVGDDAVTAALAYALWDARNTTRLQENPDEIEGMMREARSVRTFLQMFKHDVARLESGEREGWRPIESAPNDGEPVDLWAQERERYDHERITHCRFVNGEWRHARTIYDEESDDDTAVVYNPTHWRPLPAAPDKEPTP